MKEKVKTKERQNLRISLSLSLPLFPYLESFTQHHIHEILEPISKFGSPTQLCTHNSGKKQQLICASFRDLVCYESFPHGQMHECCFMGGILKPNSACKIQEWWHRVPRSPWSGREQMQYWGYLLLYPFQPVSLQTNYGAILCI